jgi:hypothetical protein
MAQLLSLALFGLEVEEGRCRARAHQSLESAVAAFARLGARAAQSGRQRIWRRQKAAIEVAAALTQPGVVGTIEAILRAHLIGDRPDDQMLAASFQERNTRWAITARRIVDHRLRGLVVDVTSRAARGRGGLFKLTDRGAAALGGYTGAEPMLRVDADRLIALIETPPHDDSTLPMRPLRPRSRYAASGSSR